MFFERLVKQYVDGDPSLPRPFKDAYKQMREMLLTTAGELSAAKEYLCKALGLNEQLRGAGHTLVGNDHTNLGRYYYASGDKAAAAAEFRKALDIYKENVKRRRLPRKHPYIEEALIWLKRTGC